MRPQAVIDMVADAYGVAPHEISLRLRTRPLPEARQTAALLMLDRLHLTTTEVGSWLGYKDGDHSTVVYGRRRARAQMRADPDYAALVGALHERIDLMQSLVVMPMGRALHLASAMRRHRRAAIAATVQDLVGMATRMMDLWEVAEAAELAAKAEDAAARDGLLASIAEHMAAFRGSDFNEGSE